MLEPPAVRVPLFGEEPPTATFPNGMVEGDTPSWPAARPFPVRDTVRFPFAALLTTERLPLALPPLAGENIMATLMLWPAGMIAGSAGAELKLKPVPVTDACVTVALVPVEVLVTTTEAVVLFPSAMAPKFTGLGEAASVPEAALCTPLVLTGATLQPTSKAVDKNNAPRK
jgi:hypothetical protein